MEKVFIDRIPGLVMYVERYDQGTRELSGIMIQDERKPDEPLTIFAERGKLSVDPVSRRVRLGLLKGSVHNNRDDRYRLINFDEYDLNLNLRALKDIRRSEYDMTLSELSAGVHGGEKDKKARREMELEFHRRFATPFACFVFGLVGVPLGIQNRRSGKGGGFAISIALLVLYYVVLSASKTLGEKGALSAALAMWLPNLSFLTLGGIFFLRAAAERPPLGGVALTSLSLMFTGLLRRIRGEQ
jgi:lipopolysaccharide export system permease protein